MYRKKERLLNVNQVAEILGIKSKTLYQWKWLKKHLPFIKVGRSLRVSAKDLNKFINKNKTK